jgi:hypothetical protein
MMIKVWSKSGLLFCLLLIIAGRGYPQKLSLKTIIDTNRIVLGDQTGLSYTIERKDDVTVQLPAFDKDLTDGVEIIGSPVVDSVKIKGDGWKMSLDLTITSFDTGIYYIPPQRFILRDNSFTDTLLSPATYLEVFGVKIDTTGTIRDIKPPANVPFTIGELMLYILPLLVLAVIAWFVIAYIRKRKGKETLFAPSKPEEPPHITAFRELDKIKAQKLWQQKQVKEYYTRITWIIRWYIYKRFEIHALEETSDEILHYIGSLNLDDINLKNLESLLNLADLVKFAKGEPKPEDNIVHLDNAYEFIKKTKQDITDQTIKKESIDKERKHE